MATVPVLILGLIAGISAFPSDPVISKWGEGLRFSYLEDDSGNAHLVDNWLRLSDVATNARYNPDASNAYHLFTRENPRQSQPLILNDATRLHASNFDGRKRTVFLMHGFFGTVTSTVNTALTPAFLAAADCNVIVLDWSSGSTWGPRAIQAGQAAGRFINWVNSVTGSSPAQYHLVGFSVGGHGIGHMARTINGNVGYVTSLDPAERWDSNEVINRNDGAYTEVIHTSTLADQNALGDADFYPNGGRNQPGCINDICHHSRSFYFLAESLTNPGGFTGTRCQNVAQAHAGSCNQAGPLRMGGLLPKTGSSGIFHLTTNRGPPFSQG